MFQNDRVSLIVVSKFTVFALFYFVFEGNFHSTSPRGGGGDGGCLFSEFYGIVTCTCTITGQAFHNFVHMVHLTQQHKIKQ